MRVCYCCLFVFRVVLFLVFVLFVCFASVSLRYSRSPLSLRPATFSEEDAGTFPATFTNQSCSDPGGPGASTRLLY